MRSQTDSLQRDIAAGAIGGIAGALLMTGAMTMAKKQALITETLPHRAERKLATQVGVTALSAQQEKVLAQGGHLAVGAIYGAGYGLLDHLFNLPTVAGPFYGLAVYATNLAGLGPALDLVEGPWHEEPKEVGRRMMMHALFGLVTAVVAKQIHEAGEVSRS